VATWIILFVIIDLIVVMVVAWLVVARRRLGPPGGPPGQPGGVARFAASVHAQIGDYLRARYSGDPRTLPGVLPELIGRIESQARAEGLELGREVIEMLVLRSIVKHRLAGEREVRRAIEDARPEATL